LAANIKTAAMSLGLKVGIVCQDLFAVGAGSKQVEHVLHADAKASNTWTTPETSRLTAIRSSALISAS
jgi:hypothetical protein